MSETNWIIKQRGEVVDTVGMQIGLNSREVYKILVEEGYPESIKVKKQ